MLPDRRMSEDEVCPIRDELLGVPRRREPCLRPGCNHYADIRARLALYCYRRGHLHTRVLAVAANCDQDDLVRSGGHVGAFLFAKSREAPSPASIASVFGTRRTVTLFAKCCQL
jgi:hypothetical protein